MKVAEQINYCCSCFSQNLELTHVDLEAYFDGPVLTSGTENNPIKVAVDDLVLCETCLAEAGAVIGLYKSDNIKKENEELGENVEKKHEEILELHALVSDLQKSLSHYTEEKIQRPARKPKIVELDDALAS